MTDDTPISTVLGQIAQRAYLEAVPDPEEACGRLGGIYVSAGLWADVAREREAETERLRQVAEAARPFAALAEEVDRFRHSDDSTCPHRLRAGDLRALRSALANLDGGET